MRSFDQPLKVRTLLAGFDRPWFVAGGWAVDLFLGRVTREHKDIEIAVFRDDQLQIQRYLKGRELKKLIPEGGGRFDPWEPGEWLELPVHEIHARSENSDPPELEILLNEASQGEWRFRRNMEIVLPLSKLGRWSDDGIPYLCPEVILLYKAKNPAPFDEADFNHVRPRLTERAITWLRNSLGICHPGHHWLMNL